MKYRDGVFEWMIWKAERNLEKQGVSFEAATEAFPDTHAVDEYEQNLIQNYFTPEDGAADQD